MCIIFIVSCMLVCNIGWVIELFVCFSCFGDFGYGLYLSGNGEGFFFVLVICFLVKDWIKFFVVFVLGSNVRVKC